MELSPEYDQTRVEFEDEWSRSNIEDLLNTNNYRRAKEERRIYEHYIPKNELILEAGCGLGPKVIYFKKYFFNRKDKFLFILRLNKTTPPKALKLSD